MLTKRQEQVLDFIRDHSRENGFPPSVREIGERFGLSPATVHDHIKALERKGSLERRANRSRSLVVAGTERQHATPIDVPVVGRVAAGSPILAEENIEDVVRLPEGWTADGSFLLKVEGDSMEGAHILDGDYVLVRPQQTASNGEIVIALIEDEATVKRFYKAKNRVELRAENPAYGPIEIESSGGVSVGIVGKVVGVMRF
jgi:repressor LexA